MELILTENNKLSDRNKCYVYYGRTLYIWREVLLAWLNWTKTGSQFRWHIGGAGGASCFCRLNIWIFRSKEEQYICCIFWALNSISCVTCFMNGPLAHYRLYKIATSFTSSPVTEDFVRRKKNEKRRRCGKKASIFYSGLLNF